MDDALGCELDRLVAGIARRDVATRVRAGHRLDLAADVSTERVSDARAAAASDAAPRPAPVAR